MVANKTPEHKERGFHTKTVLELVLKVVLEVV